MARNLQNLRLHFHDQTNQSQWSMFYLSDDGKRRPALDIFVPKFVSESVIENFLEDICHEWTTEKHNSVRRLN